MSFLNWKPSTVLMQSSLSKYAPVRASLQHWCPRSECPNTCMPGSEPPQWHVHTLCRSQHHSSMVLQNMRETSDWRKLVKFTKHHLATGFLNKMADIVDDLTASFSHWLPRPPQKLILGLYSINHTTTSHEIWNPRDMALKLFDRSQTWKAHQQYCGRCASQI